MSINRRLPLVATIAAAFVACRSLTERTDLSPQAGLPLAQARVIQVDSEVFAAVVREQLAAVNPNPPFHYDRIRYDSEPWFEGALFPIVAPSSGERDTTLFARPDSALLQRLADTRKTILRAAGVAEGPRSSPPVVPTITFNVSLPIRGEPPQLRTLRWRSGSPVRSGEVWTVVVESLSQESAWIFRRTPTGTLVLAEIVTYFVAD